MLYTQISICVLFVYHLSSFFEGESYKEQGIFPTSGGTHTTPEPQKEQLEPTFQSIESGSLDKITDTHIEKSTSQLPQDERIVSAKEEGTCAASKSEQTSNIASSSKTPLSRYYEMLFNRDSLHFSFSKGKCDLYATDMIYM